jgi:hypothetical protein
VSITRRNILTKVHTTKHETYSKFLGIIWRRIEDWSQLKYVRYSETRQWKLQWNTAFQKELIKSKARLNRKAVLTTTVIYFSF